MLVYGKYKAQYTLQNPRPEPSQFSTVYDVAASGGQCARIYDTAHCTEYQESRIADAMRGAGSVPGPVPAEMVYADGRFVGYLFTPAPTLPSVDPPPAAKPPAGAPTAPLLLLLSMGVGLVLSLVVYYVLFDLLSGMVSADAVRFNLRGIPMLLTGWIALLLVWNVCRRQGYAAVLLSGAAFLLVSLLTFAAISLVVGLVKSAYVLLVAWMPGIIIIVAIIWLIRTTIGRH